MPQTVYLDANPNALAVSGVDGNSGHPGGANRRAFLCRFHGGLLPTASAVLRTEKHGGSGGTGAGIDQVRVIIIDYERPNCVFV